MKSKIVIGTVAMVVATNLLAVPAPYSKFGALNIENKTRSTLIRDNEDSGRVWVLPPATGEVSIKGFHASGNVGFCDGLRTLYKASNSTAKRIARVVEESDAALADVKAAQKKLDEARTALGELKTNPAATKMIELNDQLTTVNERIVDVATQLDSCNNACEELTAEYQSLREEAKNIREELRTVRAENREIAAQVSRAENRVAQAQANVDGVTAPYDQMVLKLVGYRNQLFSMFSNEAKLEGGVVSMDYDTGWSQAVQKLQASYPQYGFEKVQTYDVKVNTNPIASPGEDISEYYNSLPMLLSYSVAGLPFLKTGEIKNELNSIPETISGDYRLSLIGACPRAVKNFFEGVDVRPDLDQDGLPKYALTLEYSYPATFKYKVTASYNMYKMYELIKKESSHGGFFSTRTYKSVSESNMSNEAFNIDWKSEDPDEHLSAKERGDIAVEFRQNLMDRVLKAMATPVYTGKPAGPEGAGVPPENGAVVLGDGISKACPLNIYCQIGGWILKGLGAIFGSSESESRFKTTSDFTASETWSAEQARYQPGIATFAR